MLPFCRGVSQFEEYCAENRIDIPFETIRWARMGWGDAEALHARSSCMGWSAAGLLLALHGFELTSNLCCCLVVFQ